MDIRTFAFLIVLVGVVNGLGLVLWVTGFAKYCSRLGSLEVKHYWVFALWALTQFMMHIMIWWFLWGMRDVETFNFLTYVYVLTGPILTYMGSSMLMPDMDRRLIDVRAHYFHVRRAYFSVFALVWLWAIFVWPVLLGRFAPTAPIFALGLVGSVILRFSANPTVHAVLVVMNWVLIITFLTLFGLELGGVARLMT
jgi:hypothetical protein